ncbi:MAG TPA: phosphate ABC transporter substrate-binding protein [Candidatus Anoxymicrobiaceae bacterium]
MDSRPGKKRLIAAICIALAVAVVTLAGGCGGQTQKQAARGRVKVSGSTTVLPIAQEAAAEYSDANPGVRVDVQGGGSSVGVTQLIQGIVDIGMSSRNLNPDEVGKGLINHDIAFDVIAIVVNPSMPITNLSDAQVKAIFLGKVKSWKAVGGPDKPIVVVIRDQASGTRDIFDKKALGATDTKVVESTGSAIQCSSNGVMREIVGSTPNAIGYISFGYVNQNLKAISFKGVAPEVKTAATGLYPIARFLRLYTKGEAKGVVKGYIDFMLSDKFQNDIVAREYVKIKDVNIK